MVCERKVKMKINKNDGLIGNSLERINNTFKKF